MRSTPASRHSGLKRALFHFSVAAALSVGVTTGAQAAEFGTPLEDLNGSWDTTLSVSTVQRVQSSSNDIICDSNGGNAYSCNYDDGTLNYGTGTVSEQLKFLSEIQLDYKNIGLFVRGTGYYDFKADNTDRTSLSKEAKDDVEKDLRMLDAYLYGRFDIGSMPAEVRVGKQVVNWGESTFFLSGMSALNIFDTAKLRGAAVNLREGLLPQHQVYASISPTDNLSLEGFYQYKWNRTQPDAVGTWFSSNDFAARGAEFVMLGFGQWSDQGTDWTPLGGFFDPNFQHVPRAPSDQPKDDGQYGFALRYFMPDFLGGTEVGLYYANYHSRLPVLSGRSGTQAGFGNGTGVAFASIATAQALGSGLSFDAAVATGTAQGLGAAALAGGDISASEMNSWATVAANTALGGGSISGLAGQLASDQFAKTASYRAEYPEDIKIYGATFSTDLFGIAWQGEYTYKQDTPLQLDDVELLYKALSPMVDGLSAAVAGPLDCVAAGGSNPDAIGPLGCYGQQGPAGINEEVQGWVEKDVSQFQTTFTYLSDPILGAQVGAFVVEGAWTYVHDFEDKKTGGPNGQGLRYDGPGTFVSGNAPLAGFQRNRVEGQNNFADEFSWGYRLRTSLTYDNLIGPWSVTPSVGWAQDVKGVTPGPGGNFIQGRNTLTLGLRGVLQNKWQIDATYTTFNGAGHHNLVRDRDFIALSASLSF